MRNKLSDVLRRTKSGTSECGGPSKRFLEPLLGDESQIDSKCKWAGCGWLLFIYYWLFPHPSPVARWSISDYFFRFRSSSVATLQPALSVPFKSITGSVVCLFFFPSTLGIHKAIRTMKGIQQKHRKSILLYCSPSHSLPLSVAFVFSCRQMINYCVSSDTEHQHYKCKQQLRTLRLKAKNEEEIPVLHRLIDRSAMISAFQLFTPSLWQKIIVFANVKTSKVD